MNKRLLVLVAVAAVGLLGRVAEGSTNCTQKFTFLARTRGANPTFWIGEDLAGECHYSQLLQVAIVKGKAVLIRSDLELQKDWAWLAAPMKNFRTEEPIELMNVKGEWRTKGVKWFIESPARNEQLIDAFGRHITDGGDNGNTWNKKMGPDGIVLPVVDGFDVELVYYYDSGLYVNYEIYKVYYFAKSGYLLAFTGQKRLAVGGDTMHGFVLLRRTK